MIDDYEWAAIEHFFRSSSFSSPTSSHFHGPCFLQGAFACGCYFDQIYVETGLHLKEAMKQG